MKIYLINGKCGSGKTTFENLCLRYLKFSGKIFSSIDPIKELATQIGWNGVKDARNRKFLSELKSLLVEYNDYPNICIEKELKQWAADMEEFFFDPNKLAAFIDVREPRELIKLTTRFRAKSIFIMRDINEEPSNSSDANVENYTYDFYINNNGTIEDLNKQVKEFIREENLYVWNN